MNPQEELDNWFKQFPEKGSTWQSTNQRGDAYITFMIYCRHVLGLTKAIQYMKQAIQKEVNKTGIISVRMAPKIAFEEVDGSPAREQGIRIGARLVSYKGNLADKKIPPDVWHYQHDLKEESDFDGGISHA